MGILEFTSEPIPEKTKLHNKVVMRAKGPAAELLLLEDRVRISRKGSLEQALQGDTDIFLSQISAVQFKKAGRLMPGHLRFSFGGMGKSKLRSGLDSANTTVRFDSKQEKEFVAMKEAIEGRIASPHAAPEASSPPA